MNELRAEWLLDPDIHFVNHGSFGACPTAVLEHQQRLREQLEREPVIFMQRELPAHLEEARAILGGFVGADPQDLAFVTNATSAVNAVLRSLRLGPDDELVITDQAYPACARALDFVASRSGASIKVVPIPLEALPEEMLERVVSATSENTRLLLVDHIASPTAVIFPIEDIVSAMSERGIDVLVDGAHAPGMVPLGLEDLGAAYYTGNCHKWMCAPKGVGFLYVRPDRQEFIVPPVISHGYEHAAEPGGFRAMFDWMGTADPTPALSIGTALSTVGSLVPGGWPAVMRANKDLAAAGAELVAAALGHPARTPSAAAGSMVAFELPPGYPDGARWDPLQDRLLFEHAVEAPIVPWPQAPRRLLRISAHIYNDLDDYRALAEGLAKLFG